MNLEHARKINSAACFMWMFQQGFSERLDRDHIATIQNATVGQIQTASEVIEAENAEMPAINGVRHLSTMLAPEAAAKLKAYAMTLPRLP
jgi:hypothetical protein